MMKTNLQFFADPNPEPKPNDSNQILMVKIQSQLARPTHRMILER